VTEGASLNVNGSFSPDQETLENEVIFESDRLEPDFSDVVYKQDVTLKNITHTLNEGDYQLITWYVNASGDANQTYIFM